MSVSSARSGSGSLGGGGGSLGGGGGGGSLGGEESLLHEVEHFRGEVETMRKRYLSALDQSESEAAQLRMQVITLTGELAEAKLRETEARHDAEGQRHLARIVEAEGSAVPVPGGSRRGAAPAADLAALSPSTPADTRELLENSQASLEQAHAELQWWDEHGPQLVRRSDDLALQLENASRASSESAAKVAHLRAQLQAAQQHEREGRAECAHLQQACAELRSRLDGMEGGRAQLEELVRRLAEQQQAAAARERQSYEAKLRLAVALGDDDGEAQDDGRELGLVGGGAECEMSRLALRAEALRQTAQESAQRAARARLEGERLERDNQGLQAVRTTSTALWWYLNVSV